MRVPVRDECTCECVWSAPRWRCGVRRRSTVRIQSCISRVSVSVLSAERGEVMDRERWSSPSLRVRGVARALLTRRALVSGFGGFTGSRPYLRTRSRKPVGRYLSGALTHAEAGRSLPIFRTRLLHK